MKLTSKVLTNAVRVALIPAVSLSFCSLALGQNADPQAAQPNAQASQQNQSQKPQAITLGNVVVTGTHIPSSSVVTAQPITIVSNQQIQATGLATVGQLLEQMPSIAPTMNSAFNFESNGASNLDLRYLGAKRILVLVNGQRWATDIEGTTDMNSIPLTAVDHIEVLKAGASSVYGSDAIAGVVNIVLLKSIQGGKASAYYGIWHGDSMGSHWGGQTKQYSFTLGNTTDNSGWLFTAEYKHNNRIPAVNRYFSATPVPGTGVSRGSSSTPQGRFEFVAPTLDNPANSNVTPAPSTGLTAAQCPARNFGTKTSPQYLPFCNLTVITGTDGTSAADFKQFTGPDHYNWIMPAGNSIGDSILNPITIKSGFMTGHYDLTSSVRFTSSLAYTETDSTTGSAPNLLTMSSSGTIAANQQYNPFGFAISVDPVQVAPTGGPNGGPLFKPTLQFIGRRLAEFPERVRNYQSQTMHFNADVNGLLNLGASEWTWDVGYLYMTLRDNEIQTAGTNGPNFNLATGDAAACQANPNCVPFNLFGGQGVNGTGSITPAMVSYLYYPTSNNDGTTQRIEHLDLANADLVDLPAGPLGFAAGYQFDAISGYFNPDTVAQAGLTQSGLKTFPTVGGYSIDSFYTEFNIPILANLPAFYNLNLDIASRYSKYSTYGSTTRSTAGLKWQPVEDLALRTDWAQGFRAPNIDELFAAQGFGNPTVFDPCSGYATKPGVNPTVVQNCQNAGVPGGYVQPDQQVRTLGGGNRSLHPETSISKDVGFVYNPHQLPALTVDASYYHIEIGNTIQTYGANNILNACYLSGDAGFCNRVQRSPLGTITQISNLETNVGTTYTDGIDVGVKYSNLTTPFGDFSFNFQATHVRDFKQYLPLAGGTSIVSLVGVERAGSVTPLSVPAWKAGLDIGWQMGNWNATWRVHYVDQLWETNCSDSFDGGPLSLTNLGLCSNPNYQNNGLSMNRLARTVWHDAQVVYHGSHQLDYTFGINNIFDKVPPNETQPIEDMAFDPTQYFALLGRFFYARIGVKF